MLVADDEPAMNELVARHLRSLTNPKVDVIQANDGAEAWRLARQHLPDLVVLDVMMPEMSGWEVCRKIREDVAFAHTGVVMLTGIGETLNSLTSPLYGADAYIDKPFQAEELHEKVRDTLSARASQREGVDRPSSATNLDEILRAKPLAKTSGKKAPAKPAKKAAAKKAPAKPAKKAAAKKAPAKPAKPVKKVAAKKPAAKKAPAKKPAAKKAAAKKPAVKKAPAKPAKPAAKKAPAKKPAKKATKKKR
ncbi:MAG: response regulator [Polyangiaceae bacterium]|nr:response regulator [Polyangiaceae bacterium]